MMSTYRTRNDVLDLYRFLILCRGVEKVLLHYSRSKVSNDKREVDDTPTSASSHHKRVISCICGFDNKAGIL